MQVHSTTSYRTGGSELEPYRGGPAAPCSAGASLPLARLSWGVACSSGVVFLVKLLHDCYAFVQVSTSRRATVPVSGKNDIDTW